MIQVSTAYPILEQRMPFAPLRVELVCGLEAQLALNRVLGYCRKFPLIIAVGAGILQSAPSCSCLFFCCWPSVFLLASRVELTPRCRTPGMRTSVSETRQILPKYRPYHRPIVPNQALCSPQFTATDSM